MASAVVRNKRAGAAAGSNDGVLPTDLLREVLVRVPAKELCRLRLVCRTWRSLTSDPGFAKAHASRHPLVVGLQGRRGRPGEIHLMDLSGNMIKRVPVPDVVRVGYLMSHLDLVCCSSLDYYTAYLHNPATGIDVVLPADIPISAEKLPTRTFVPGYVHSTGEYKVLRIHDFFDENHYLRCQRCHIC